MIITPILQKTNNIIDNIFYYTIIVTTKIDASIKCGLGAISCCYCCLNKEILEEYYYNQYDIIFGNTNHKNEKIRYEIIDNMNKVIENQDDINDRVPENNKHIFTDTLKKIKLTTHDYF